MECKSCPICQSLNPRFLVSVPDVEYGTTTKSYDYFECMECKVIYMESPPTTILDVIYPHNYYSVREHEKTGLRGLLQSIKQFFDKRLFARALSLIDQAEIRCMDVGGGDGWALTLVKELDVRVTKTMVIETNDSAQISAKKRGHDFIHSTTDLLNRPLGYELVLMLNLVEHVENPRNVLRTIYSVMNAGGILVVKTPNTNSLNRKIFDRFYWGGYHAPRHWVLFNKANFSTLSEECGFEIAKFYYTQGAPQWTASVLGSIELIWPNIIKKPIDKSLLFSGLLVVFSIIDCAFLPFGRTDQMIFLLRKPR